MFGCFFSEDENITSYSQVMKCDQQKFKDFFHGMLNKGVYLAPSPFETGFVSSAHSDIDIDKTITNAESVLGKI
jgi:glutamate-1-semialdehyde 2,1-aminomutase